MTGDGAVDPVPHRLQTAGPVKPRSTATGPRMARAVYTPVTVCQYPSDTCSITK
jgi:hypothetical protein